MLSPIKEGQLAQEDVQLLGASCAYWLLTATAPSGGSELGHAGRWALGNHHHV